MRPFLPVALFMAAAICLQAQSIGIVDGFPYLSDPADTAASPYLPSLPAEPAGAHGFLGSDGEGGFRFADGTPARFFGVSLQWTACFPDSVEAIRMAARLRKLGVNLVRFEYMDNAYDWYQVASILDQKSGFRTLNEAQARRFDWLFWQLKRNGIYAYMTLESSRVPRPEDGLGSQVDSAYWIGLGMYPIYPEARAAHKLVARLLLDHVNPFTGLAYKADPAVAMLELMDKGSLLDTWRQNLVTYQPNGSSYSWKTTRRLDTLFAAYLKQTYGSDASLAAAWSVPTPSGGYPNLIQEGSFEGSFENRWLIQSYDGVTASVILNQGDTVPDGKYSMSVRVHGSQGNVFAAYMLQQVPLSYNRLYTLSFKAKSSEPAGTQLVLYGAQSADGGLWSGLYTTLTVDNYWKSYQSTFLVPIESTASFNIAFYFGGSDGSITFDDIQLREVAPMGLLPTESIANASVARIPWGDNAGYLVSSRRVEDQSRFYMGLQKDYLSDLSRFIKDTVGAAQPLTGASLYWGSTVMESSLEADMDFTASGTASEFVSGNAGSWQMANASPLRTNSGGPLGVLARFAHARQPYVATYYNPYPNRYQAESMLYLPAYAGLQGYDGVIWDTYADNTVGTSAGIDSGSFYTLAKNPLLTALMPAASQIFRSGSIDQALTTIGIRQSREQMALLPRMEWGWGSYGIPGGFNARVPAIDRVVVDSVDARYPTQLSDLSLPQETSGELLSDTRQIFWEYGRGSLTINAPKAQGATGALTRAGGIMTDLLDIDLFSGNETSTLLWVPVDSAARLGDRGRSLLVVASRTEGTGLHWADSTHADRWGSAPMLLDPVRARITFKLPYADAEVAVTPLDASGMPGGAPLAVTHNGKDYMVTIDQAATHAVWYGVEIGGALSTVAADEGGADLHLSATSDPAVVAATLPAQRRSVVAEMVDPLGRRIALLHAGPMKEGRTLLRLDVGAHLPSGLYLVRLLTERGEQALLKVPLVR